MDSDSSEDEDAELRGLFYYLPNHFLFRNPNSVLGKLHAAVRDGHVDYIHQVLSPGDDGGKPCIDLRVRVEPNPVATALRSGNLCKCDRNMNVIGNAV